MYADGPQWTNVLFMDMMPGTSSNSHFLWDFWVYHDPAAEAHFWSSELDLWQVLGGNEFMIGSQCDFGDGYWATWDSQGVVGFSMESLVRTGRRAGTTFSGTMSASTPRSIATTPSCSTVMHTDLIRPGTSTPPLGRI